MLDLYYYSVSAFSRAYLVSAVCRGDIILCDIY